METTNQVITIAAVLLGALTSFVATARLERSRFQRDMAIRWDDRRVDAYLAYISAVRRQVVQQRLLYEVRHGTRPSGTSVGEHEAEVLKATERRGTAFEAVMLLGSQPVIAAAHRLNRAVIACEWRAMGQTVGSDAEWDDLNVQTFTALNSLHEAARTDVGVMGAFAALEHSAGGLIQPNPGDQSPSS